MTSSPSIHFYGGIGTIGGTKVVIAEAGHRVLFDFGLTYDPRGDFWGGRIQPRTGSGRLKDLVALGYVPRLDGLYRPEAAAQAGLQPGCGEQTQVFISHIHLDHMAVVDLLADEVPVWMHTDSLRLFRAVAETGEPPSVPAGAREFAWGQEIRVGPLTVIPLAVDHDLPGASGLLIRTSAGAVAYTGDLRLHGANPGQVAAFIETARAARPKLLLIEGTRLGEPDASSSGQPRLSEMEVPARVAELARNSPALALITLYPRNTPRIAAIASAVRAVGRALLLMPEAAHIYQAMGGNLADVALYQRAGDRQATATGTAPDWLGRLLNSDVRVLDADALHADPSAYLLQLSGSDIPELVDIQPAPGSVFIHSNGEPLGRFDPAFEVLLRWLAHFGLELQWAASTGHAAPADLVRVVESVRPERFMPIHSRAPALLAVEAVRRVLPELGAGYDIATGARLQ